MSTKANVKAAIYARVSTPNQEKEATIESQIAEIESYVKAKGYEVAANHYYIDQAVSGGTLDRPALNQLRNWAAEGEFDVVICLCPDRLARHYPYQWTVMDELKRCGVETVFVQQLGDPNAPEGQFLLGMQGIFAEYERIKITERLRRGKLHRIRQGQLISPRAPYGYTYIPVSELNGGRWDVNPKEAAVVEQMFRWYTDDELTICQLVDSLNASHEKTPPRGKRWHFSTVERLLKQPAYVGKTYYNRTKSSPEAVGQPRKHQRGLRQTPTHDLRSQDEWIEIPVTPLLDEPLWQIAQERLAMNQKFAQRNNTQRFYLLRSLLVCNVCGRTLTARGRASGKDGAVTYYCTNRGKHADPDVPPHKISVAGADVEPLVWQAVSELLRNPSLIEDAWQHDSQQHDHEPNEAERLQTRLRALQQQWTRLLDGFQDGLFDKDTLAQRKDQIDQEQSAIQTRLDSLLRLQRQTDAKELMIQDFHTFCQQILHSLDSPSPELQQDVIRLLIDHIVVHHDSIVIKHIIPTDDDCRLLPGRR